MRKHDDHGRLDEAIDRAVREIMDADMRPAFRRRVLARLEPRWRRAWIAWPALATAALLIVIAGITTFQQTPSPPAQELATTDAPAAPVPAPTDLSSAPAADATAPAAQPTPADARPEGASSPARRSESIFGPRTDRVAAANIAPAEGDETLADGDASELPALPPSGIAPLAAPPPIVVDPIAIPAIRVPPPGGSHD